MERFYTSRDMAKLGCDDCAGCCDCCQGMGDTIICNPYDIYLLEKELELNFQELLEQYLDLHTEEGMIVPHLRMVGVKERCIFLNEQDRCSIHGSRPGLCRLFPLGRQYFVPDTVCFKYFVLEGACPKAKTKVKIDKWLGTPALAKNEAFILSWHNACRKWQQKLMGVLEQQDETFAKQMNMFLLQTFYGKPYDTGRDFYSQYEERMAIINQVLS